MNGYNDTITEALVNWATRQPDEKTRRWSYEIESPQIARYASELFEAGFECHNDGSVSSLDCECDCDDCSAHSCDCDRCEIGDWDYDHCGVCQATEAAPQDGNPCNTTKDEARLSAVGRYLDADYLDSTCGQHVHVDASDLTAPQVANLCRVWDRVNDLLGHTDLVGRGHNSYADEFRAGEIDVIARGGTVDRYRSVNPMGVMYHLERVANGNARGYSKSTVEFRQFAGTVDPLLIVARGYLCRAMVEWAKSNAPIYWAKNAKTARELLAEFGIRL